MQLTLGEMLYRFRLERDVEAQQVCHGICSSSTISKIESGQSIPDTLMFECLMERMGVSSELFSIMVTEGESIYLKWRGQVWDAIDNEEWDALGELLKSKVIRKVYCNKKLETQFFSYASAVYHAKQGNYAKAAELLKIAAEQTIPEQEGIIEANVLLSTLELSISMLYLYYGIKGEVLTQQQGKYLFDILDNYIDSEAVDSKEASMCYPKLVCIGVQELEILTKNEKKNCLEKAIRLLQKNKSFYDITEVLRLYISFLEHSHSKKIGFYKKQYEVFCDLFETEGFSIGFKPEVVKVRKPKYYIIQEYLLAKRTELGMTQSELSEGICEPETYSRVENGKRAPSRKNMGQLSDRLGISWNYYRGEINSTDPRAYELKHKQRLAEAEGRWKDSAELLEKLESCLDMSHLENVQYVKCGQYKLKRRVGELDDESVYTELERLLNLSKFSKNETAQLMYYSQTELEIMGHMAQMLRRQGKYEEGIQLLLPVVKQMLNSELEFEDQWNGFGYFLIILGTLYFRIGEYVTAAEILQFVKHIMLKKRDGLNLPIILDSIADNLEHIGQQHSDEYRKLYRYTFYMSDFFGLAIRETAQKIYEDKFEKNINWYDN